LDERHLRYLWEGAWEFFFEVPSLPPTLVFKFVLDGEHWMNGPDLSVPSDVDHSFDESSITFPFTAPRFVHGYDNFQIDRTKLAQDGVPRNTRADIEYDVIIIGSGMGGGTLADALSDSGVKTLILEAGGLRLPTHMKNLPVTGREPPSITRWVTSPMNQAPTSCPGCI
jgi:hypothetical protein